jgi:hypothetical protein
MFDTDAYNNVVVKASSDRNHLGLPETAEKPRIFGPPFSLLSDGLQNSFLSLNPTSP